MNSTQTPADVLATLSPTMRSGLVVLANGGHGGFLPTTNTCKALTKRGLLTDTWPEQLTPLGAQVAALASP